MHASAGEENGIALFFRLCCLFLQLGGFYQSRFLGRGCEEALFSEKKLVFSEKGGGNSVNEGLDKDFYRKGNSVKRSRSFSEPPDSEN